MTNASSSVLIVDDEAAVRNLMARWTTSLGMEPRIAAGADEAIDTASRHDCDIAVIDVMLPGRDGLWLAEQLRQAHPTLAIVIATASTDRLADAHWTQAAQEQQPIVDFLLKPFHRARFNQAVDRGRQWRRQALDDMAWYSTLSSEMADRLALIVGDLMRTGDEDREAALLAIAAARMPDVVAHGERVAHYAETIARHLGVSAALGPILKIAARFHDIGKVVTPLALLSKPSAFTAAEREIMNRHVHAGLEILTTTRRLRDAGPIVSATHERFGGGGYPLNIAGEAIPLAARIIAVADAFDSMTTDRPYRPRLDRSDAIAEILRCTPAQFDPRAVQALVAVL